MNVKHVWNWILIVEAIIFVFLLVAITTKPNQPCTLLFEVHQGANFNQPYPTYYNCSNGEPVTVIGDIHGE